MATALLLLHAGGRPPRVPLSTYRLQFHRDFTFRDARAIVDYLHALGISDCYASSYLKAVPGSPHGYDVADPTRLNPEIGDRRRLLGVDRGAARRAAWATSRPRARTTWASPSRRTRGGSTCSRTARARASRASSTSSGDPVKDELADKVLIPILGDQYGEVLERQELHARVPRRRVRRALLRRDAADRARHLCR